jgi:hypothetical protein
MSQILSKSSEKELLQVIATIKPIWSLILNKTSKNI